MSITEGVKDMSEVQNLSRCGWCGVDPLYRCYHDLEWGVPVHDDQKFFEMLILEGMQAGLSWLTILRKRDNFRKAFQGFDPSVVATFDAAKQAELLNDAGIIRNRLKIAAAINNAGRFLDVADKFGSFDRYVWSFAAGEPIVNHWEQMSEVPARTEMSDAIAKDLKERGFKFVGSTIIYAFMQATGLVMDHITTCYRYEELR